MGRELAKTPAVMKIRWARTHIFNAKMGALKKALVASGNQPPYCGELRKAELHAWMRKYLNDDQLLRIDEELRDARL